VRGPATRQCSGTRFADERSKFGATRAHVCQ
jgi:hypothetical protein